MTGSTFIWDGNAEQLIDIRFTLCFWYYSSILEHVVNYFIMSLYCMEWSVSELKAAEHVYTSQIILCFEKSFGNRKWSYKLQ